MFDKNINGVEVTCRCGKKFRAPPSKIKQGNGRFCSRRCYGQSRRAGDPASYVNNGGVREHVTVAQVGLGRPLQKTERVHHVNGVKNDNRPKNLVVCSSLRAHEVLHHAPDAICCAIWLGPASRSVRRFDLEALERGKRFCLGCKDFHELAAFGKSKKIRAHCLAYRRRAGV